MKNILLVQPFASPFPPLGLLKIANYHKERGDRVKLVINQRNRDFIPSTIYIASLFTYDYETVNKTLRRYRQRYSKARIVVGGVYATLCHKALSELMAGKDIEVHKGLFKEVEDMIPDYSLVPRNDTSFVNSSRGCPRKCHFCSLPLLEPKFEARLFSVNHLIHPGHKKIALWDNNILFSPYWKDIFKELEESGLRVDINQGIDARLLTEEVVDSLLKMKITLIRLAYDTVGVEKPVKRAIDLLKSKGVQPWRIVVYNIFNSQPVSSDLSKADTPDNLFKRIRNLIEWGVISYPCRFQIPEPVPRNSYISPYWSREEITAFTRFRAKYGHYGIISGTAKKWADILPQFLKARSFQEGIMPFVHRKSQYFVPAFKDLDGKGIERIEKYLN